MFLSADYKTMQYPMYWLFPLKQLNGKTRIINVNLPNLEYLTQLMCSYFMAICNVMALFEKFCETTLYDKKGNVIFVNGSRWIGTTG